MARSDRTTAIIDGILTMAVTTGTITAALIAPGLLQIINKPAQSFLKSLDKRAREREIRRITAYILRQKLLTTSYQHGIQLTNRGRARLQQRSLKSLRITKPDQWDHAWRLILFDIPVTQKFVRSTFVNQLRQLGLQPLQQSVWIHPFPCREEISIVASNHGIEQYITYIETKHIDQDELLRVRFEDTFHTN